MYDNIIISSQDEKKNFLLLYKKGEFLGYGKKVIESGSGKE